MARGDDRRDPLIALRIPPALDQQLRAAAADTGSTLSEIVRHAIEHQLAAPTPAAAKRIRLVKAAKPSGMCEHRTRPGNYCRHCETVV